MKDPYVSLHTHTEYSVGDATIKIPQLMYTVKENGQKAVAITDHGTTEGWSELYTVGQDTNVKPIFGCEFYCKPFLEKPKNNTRFHLVVLAKNDDGAKIIKKMEYISTKHKYRKLLLPYPVLFDEGTDDLFITTACSLGTLGQCFDPEKDCKPEEAPIFLNDLLDKFGKENVAIEFQFHPKYPTQGIINEELLKLYDESDAKYIIATTDAHFISKSLSRQIIQADAWHKNIKDITPSLDSNCLGTSSKILKFAELSEFSDLDLVQDMIKNTSIIADKCNVGHINNIGESRVLPKFNKHANFKRIFMKKPRRLL